MSSPQSYQSCTGKPSLPSAELVLSLLEPINSNINRDEKKQLSGLEDCEKAITRMMAQNLTIPLCIERFKASTSSSFCFSRACSNSSLKQQNCYRYKECSSQDQKTKCCNECRGRFSSIGLEKSELTIR